MACERREGALQLNSPAPPHSPAPPVRPQPFERRGAARNASKGSRRNSLQDCFWERHEDVRFCLVPVGAQPPLLPAEDSRLEPEPGGALAVRTVRLVNNLFPATAVPPALSDSRTATRRAWRRTFRPTRKAIFRRGRPRECFVNRILRQLFLLLVVAGGTWLSSGPAPAMDFVHPGLLDSREELELMKRKEARGR